MTRRTSFRYGRVEPSDRSKKQPIGAEDRKRRQLLGQAKAHAEGRGPVNQVANVG